jgi:group II intron reverse transcriptase/maturase
MKARMSDYGIQRLSKLVELNANTTWVNRDLYRLLYRPELYIVAYERVKSSPGSMTVGTDRQSIDGFSMKQIEAIIDTMRNESFQFSRARRIKIPKANGKLRPLGIPTTKDKIVQEALRMILESIYDGSKPTFLACSHGFRPGRSTHTCLKEVRTWHNVSWFIEGDICACFDEVDHHVLIDTLARRIADTKFLDLIRKALKAGYLEGKMPVGSLSGTPQGSVLSPILANIYLHELDLFVHQLRQKYETGERKRVNPPYTAIVKERLRISSGKKEASVEQRRCLEQRLRQTPSLLHNDPNFIRIKYVRYADDWLIGIDGPKMLAETLRNEIQLFLKEQLKLTLNLDKTHIRNARAERAFFLGTYVSIGKGEPKHGFIKRSDGTEIRKRVTGWTTQLEAPIQRIINALAERSFCDRSGTPKAKTAWTILDLDQIVRQYNAVLRGYLNYYSFANNYANLKHIQHILQQSAMHTFGRKLQVRKPQLYKRFGANLTVVKPRIDGSNATHRLELENRWKSQPMRFLAGDGPQDRIEAYMRLRTRTKLQSSCCICGDPGPIETPGVRIDVVSNICVTGATRKWNGSVLDGVQTESGGSVVAA